MNDDQISVEKDWLGESPRIRLAITAGGDEEVSFSLELPNAEELAYTLLRFVAELNLQMGILPALSKVLN